MWKSTSVSGAEDGTRRKILISTQIATADAARRRGLWLGGTNHCVADYLARRDASDMYGRPSPARAPPLCRYIITEIWGTALHLLFLLLSTIAAAAAVRVPPSSAA